MNLPRLIRPLFCLLASAASLCAQTDTTATPFSDDEDDYSQYENLSLADSKARRYSNPKVLGLSPQRFISVGWDFQGPYDMQFSPVSVFAEGDPAPIEETRRARLTHGLRLSANIPIISRNSILWQLGGNWWDTRYQYDQTPENSYVAQLLSRNGLRTAGLNTTVFKPLNETSFILFQGAADLSGDYGILEFQPLRFLRYSGALVWGRRPHDRKQWGVGIARTYRVGEMNYIPVFLFNYTSLNRKWGTEILFPARAHYRRTFNPRSLLLAGYELEGQSYLLRETPGDFDGLRTIEIRRGEARARIEYQRQLAGFIWIAAQLGYRYNWSFNADYTADNGRDFFRGFFGNQTYAMLNQIGNPLYFQITLNLVSP